MAKVLSSSQLPLDNTYYATSQRCESPSPPRKSEGYEIPRSSLIDPYDTYSESTLASSLSSSPELSSVAYSTNSSRTSSVTSSVCLDAGTPKSEVEEPLVFPVYDYSAEPEPPVDDEDDDTTSDSSSDTSTMTPERKSSLPAPSDDTSMRHEPSRHVDYLSHEWREEDIWASWRYIVGRRKAYANASRLENASWRTWAKVKYRLKTVSPHTLNWLKDYDVTWLYGPLSTCGETTLRVSPLSPPTSPSYEEKLPTPTLFKTKPILKKRSLSEIMLQRSLTTSSLLKQATAAIEAQQSDTLEYRPTLVRAESAFASLHVSTVGTAAQPSDMPSLLSTGCQSPNSSRHIHFNDRVQQCIAVDHADDDYFHGVTEEDAYFDDCEIGHPLKWDKPVERSSANEPQTIAHLPSTTLKYVEDGRRGMSFMSLNSIFGGASTTESSVQHDKQDSDITDAVVEEAVPEVPWGAGESALGPRSATPGPSHCDPVSEDPFDDSDEFQFPNYDDDENEQGSGLLGRAVDAVNTARDIAHVLWNVGWRQ